VLRVPGGEVGARHPRAEGLLVTPLRHDEAHLAVVVRAQELEALEPLVLLDLPGAGGEPLGELLEPLLRNGDGIDLHDAHAPDYPRDVSSGAVSACRRPAAC
jgi:hypothetical protein